LGEIRYGNQEENSKRVHADRLRFTARDVRKMAANYSIKTWKSGLREDRYGRRTYGGRNIDFIAGKPFN
jgi:hypothetical protein